MNKIIVICISGIAANRQISSNGNVKQAVSVISTDSLRLFFYSSIGEGNIVQEHWLVVQVHVRKRPFASFVGKKRV